MALLNKIKYCRIVRKFIRRKYKYYVQLVLDGIPPIKVDKSTGKIKNSIGNGNVGIDIGTQTIAISSKYDVKLLELVPEVDNIEKEKRILLRKLDRQRRVNNPNNYNKNGTIKKGIRINGKLTKLKWYNKELFKIDTTKVKASQYNHIKDEYIKKKLSERWNDFGDFKIQRDLYSAFIIQNVIGKKLDKIDKEQMISKFDNFKILHDKEIKRIRKYNNKLISSMGI